jgi:hypothetical protein
VQCDEKIFPHYRRESLVFHSTLREGVLPAQLARFCESAGPIIPPGRSEVPRPADGIWRGAQAFEGLAINEDCRFATAALSTPPHQRRVGTPLRRLPTFGVDALIRMEYAPYACEHRRSSLPRIISPRSAAGRISKGPIFTPGCFDINWMA